MGVLIFNPWRRVLKSQKIICHEICFLFTRWTEIEFVPRLITKNRWKKLKKHSSPTARLSAALLFWPCVANHTSRIPSTNWPEWWVSFHAKHLEPPQSLEKTRSLFLFFSLTLQRWLTDEFADVHAHTVTHASPRAWSPFRHQRRKEQNLPGVQADHSPVLLRFTYFRVPVASWRLYTGGFIETCPSHKSPTSLPGCHRFILRAGIGLGAARSSHIFHDRYMFLYDIRMYVFPLEQYYFRLSKQSRLLRSLLASIVTGNIVQESIVYWEPLERPVWVSLLGDEAPKNGDGKMESGAEIQKSFGMSLQMISTLWFIRSSRGRFFLTCRLNCQTNNTPWGSRDNWDENDSSKQRPIQLLLWDRTELDKLGSFRKFRYSQMDSVN